MVATIDERIGDSNKMPIATVLQQAARLRLGEIIELVTTFLPAPEIDVMREKGLLMWSVQKQLELIRTYVSNPMNL